MQTQFDDLFEQQQTKYREQYFLYNFKKKLKFCQKQKMPNFEVKSYNLDLKGFVEKVQQTKN